jgi:dCTP deaminase
VILTSDTIKKFVEDGQISIRPRFDEKQLRPLGLRVHIGESVLIPDTNQIVDLSAAKPKEPTFQRLDLRASPLVMKPGDFALASTVESLKIHQTLACRLDGRSTLARLGLLVHCTSETIDSIHQDFRSIVLEIANVGPFELTIQLTIPYSYGIGMIVFETLSAPVDLSLEQDQYKDQTVVTPPNLGFEMPDYN